MSYKVKANKVLFDRFGLLAAEINRFAILIRDLRSIVQNDMTIESDDLKSFAEFFKKDIPEEFNKISNNIKTIYSDTLAHIKSCNS